MSRIGKEPIHVPDGVTVNISQSTVTITGNKGVLKQHVDESIDIQHTDQYIILSRKDDTKQTRAYHGLYNKLIVNMIIGVTAGFRKELILKGVGYRVEIKNDGALFSLGYSTQILYKIPAGIQLTYDNKEKITVDGIEKQKVGQVSAEIRSLRTPDPYKGKGIRYIDEQIRMKVGKAGVK